MIFALSADDNCLMVFADEPGAIAYCEGVDVEDGLWKFFDDLGLPLDAKFSAPNSRGSFAVVSGRYSLHRSTEDSRKNLNSYLDGVAAVEGNPPLSDIISVRRYLESQGNERA